MPSCAQSSRIDTIEIKSQIIKKLGKQIAEKYFYNLKRLLSCKLSKLEFDKLCYSTIGKENIALHNLFIKSILRNACLSHGPPSKQIPSAHSRNTRMPNGHFGNALPVSPRIRRSAGGRDRRFADRPSPLGPHGKDAHGNAQEATNSCDNIQRSREQQSAPELISVGSKALLEVASVEDGEEVEQERGSPGAQSRSPVRAPLGLSFGNLPRKAFYNGFAAALRPSMHSVPETCQRTCELPDTGSLRKRLESKLEQEGLGLSEDCVNLLNDGLDAYLKRLIRPCMDLARSRSSGERMCWENGSSDCGMNGGQQEEYARRSTQCYSASSLDFQVAMESNPQLLGGDWPMLLEKICSSTR